MRFLKHDTERVPYALRDPYPEARRQLLARPPAPAPAAAAGAGPVHDSVPARAPRVWAAVFDLGLPHYLVSVFVFADGTIAIHANTGIHSTGLRGSHVVAETGRLLLEETEAALGEFSPVPDAAALPLPTQGSAQVIARTRDGDLLLDAHVRSRRDHLTELATMALLLTDIARQAIFEGYEPAEEGDVIYELTPQYRSMRQALLDWEPWDDLTHLRERVVGVAVEFGEGTTVTSLFAFADGSTSLYASDGSIATGLTGRAGVADAARMLLDAVEASIAAFEPAAVLSLPQPGRVQFILRTVPGTTAESVQFRAGATAAELANGGHPLSEAYRLAAEIRRIAAEPRT